MKILRKNIHGSWEEVPKYPYENEEELQDLLAKDVNAMLLDDIGYSEKFVTIGKEVGLENGFLDILAVSLEGIQYVLGGFAMPMGAGGGGGNVIIRQ